ncbi:unnamed protein product [Adineta ricciae]|uniref:J domain-containing protein n=1 Tax=Adineta ricciae TaxID=249248 RepID=A0A813SRM0_ADIRI|nr:unnamed protein product [Adineta ricciae]
MFRKSQQYLWRKSRTRGGHLHLYDHIFIQCTLPPTRSFSLTKCRCKTANINARNYYDLLGVEQTATQKEIRKAFVKLSKEYHPDANSADKSLHDKFVKINEAFSVLSKPSARKTYDQNLNYPHQSASRGYSAPPTARQQASTGSPFEWTARNSNNRGAYARRPTSNEFDWGTPHFDKTFYDMLRRQMEQDQKRRRSYSYNPPPGYGMINTYLAPFTIITVLLAFGILIHVLQGRMANFSDPNYVVDPRSRSYHAYREWQRLSALKNAESMPLRTGSTKRDNEDE